MSFLITFLSSFFGLSSFGLSENTTCRTTEFTTLMYHHIREYDILSPEAKNISVSPEELETQMKYLSENGYRSITSHDIQDGTVPCKSVMITFDDGYYDVINQAYPIMKQYNFVGVVGLILAKIDESDYLFWADIRALQKSGWEIASHTWHHPNLSLLDETLLPREIHQSKEDLEKWFHTKVHIFIYPKGRYRYRTLDEIRKSGYIYAFTTQTGKTSLVEKPLELKRIDVIPGMTKESFAQLIERNPESKVTTAEK